MIICHPAERRGPLLVTFRVNNADLQDRRISVVGDFNDWDRTANLLWEHPGGTHSVTLALHPGRYRFRYVTEHGRWFDDEHDFSAHGLLPPATKYRARRSPYQQRSIASMSLCAKFARSDSIP